MLLIYGGWPANMAILGSMWALSKLAHMGLQYGTHIGPSKNRPIRLKLIFFFSKNTLKSKNRHRLCKNIYMLLKIAHHKHI